MRAPNTATDLPSSTGPSGLKKMGKRKSGKSDDEIADEVIREFDRLWLSRGVFESHWDEIAKRVWPNVSMSFNALNLRTPGQKRTQDLYDSTAALSLNRFAAIVDSLLTPRNQTWHQLTTSDPDLNKNREVALYFEKVTRILFAQRYNARANFASQNNKNFRYLGAFGTACMFTDELEDGNGFKRGLRYKSIDLGQLYLAENHQGVVDKVTRRFKLSARQAIQKYGEENLPEAITAAMSTDPDMSFEFIHVVKPNDERDFIRRDFRGMKFASFHVSMTGRKLVREGGYRCFPYAVSRYEQEFDEVYGRSPMMDLLPAVKTLNEQKKTMLKAGHRATDPILLASDDGVVDGFSQRPGAMNPGGVTPDGRPLVHALPTGNFQIGKELMDDERATIKDGMLVTLFQILQETPQMTATEVLERAKEKGILLSPTIGRQQSESIEPTVHREIDILQYQNALPPMPGILREARGQYKIFHDSPLSRAQRAEEAAGVMRVMEQGMSYFNATQDQSVFDYLDIDKIMPALAYISGVPASWMRTVEQVKSLRQIRQQEHQDQKMIQAAPAAAAVMKAQAASQAASGGNQG